MGSAARHRRGRCTPPPREDGDPADVDDELGDLWQRRREIARQLKIREALRDEDALTAGLRWRQQQIDELIDERLHDRLERLRALLEAGGRKGRS